jgi:hypothetical protein
MCNAMIQWFASLPVSTVAMNAIFPGLVLSTCASAEWRELGREELLFAAALVMLWALARWWMERQTPQANRR